MPGPRDDRGLERARIEDGALDAEADIAGLRRHDAAEARTEAAGHSGLERRRGRHAALGAEAPHRLEHRRRAAGEDGGGRIAVELLAEEVGDEAAPAGGAVVGGKDGLAREE